MKKNYVVEQASTNRFLHEWKKTRYDLATVRDNFMKTSGNFYIKKNGKPDFNVHIKIPKNIVVFDVDNHGVDAVTPFKKIIEMYKIEAGVVYTKNGMHLYFNNTNFPKFKTQNLILKPFGIPIEVKNGASGSFLAKIFADGDFRKTSGFGKNISNFDTIIENADLPHVPEILKNLTADQDWNLLGLTDSQGRNEKMLRVPDEHREFVNNHVFAEPIKQLKKISSYKSTSYDAENRDYKNSKGVIYDIQFCKHLIKKFDVLDFNFSVVVKKQNEYINISTENGESVFEDMLLEYEPEAGRSSTKLESYIKYVKKRAVKQDFKNVPIHFKNGSLYKGVWYDQVLDKPSPFVLPWEYKPDAYCEWTDNLLDRISQNKINKRDGSFEFVKNEGKRKTLIDIIAHTFLTYYENENQRFFILSGFGNNGKSAFTSMIRNIWGIDYSSTMKLEELANRFSESGLVGKKVNIGDDIAGDFITDKAAGRLKTITSGEAMDFEKKHQNIQSNFQNQATLIFSTNNPPKCNDKTDGWNRRKTIIPFEYNAKKDKNYKKEKDFALKLESKKSTEYIIKLAVEAYCDHVYESGPFLDETVKKENENYTKENNSVLSYIYDKIIDENNKIDPVNLKEHFLDVSTAQAYSFYVYYCSSINRKPLYMNVFTNTVCHYCNLKTVRKYIEVSGLYENNMYTTKTKIRRSVFTKIGD